MNSALILDRDGTINIDKGYIFDKSQFEIYPDVIPTLRKLGEFVKIIYTNQSGIGRGFYTQKDYQKLTEHMLNIFTEQGIKIHATIFCPHKPDDNCLCRKPNPYILKKLIKKYNINISTSFVIGDKTSDIQLGKNIGMKTILIKNDNKTDNEYDVKPDFEVYSFKMIEELLR